MVVLALVNMIFTLLRFSFGLRQPQSRAMADPSGIAPDQLTRLQKGKVWRQFGMYL